MSPQLSGLLTETAQRLPNHVALIDAEQRICTYGELLARAQAVDWSLRELGVAPGDRIGLCAEKSIEAVAALFGILMAGAAYVPVDASSPAARSAGILSNCSVKAILAGSGLSAALQAALQEGGFPTLHLGAEIQGLEVFLATSPTPCGEASTAYILHTSGSTGAPKGSVHTNASALAFIDWCCSEFKPTSHDCFASHAPLHFDLSIFDLYVAIRCGARIRLINASEARQPRRLSQLIATDAVTVWYSTPTVLRAMLEFGNLTDHDHSSLRLVCFAGEVFPTRHLRALGSAWPRPTYVNLYGPTETNVCSFYRVKEPRHLPDDEKLAIGYACAGNQLRILCADGQQALPGEEGELLVSGASVMRGYWGPLGYDTQSFIEMDGQHWYRTGDFVKQRADGALVFCGRRDRMVKRRGFRIELDEIEAAMHQFAPIHEVAVNAWTPAAGELAISVMYTLAGDTVPSLVQLKRHCSEVLPIAMIPDHFARLPCMPHTSTGKIDYTRLKEMYSELFTN